jgi:hypothetical protein
MLIILVQTHADHVPALAQIMLGFLVFHYRNQLMQNWFTGCDFRESAQCFSSVFGDCNQGKYQYLEISFEHDSMISSDGVPASF